MKLELQLSKAKGRWLHFAPERCFQERFKRAKNLEYVSVDLASPAADVRADICSLPFSNDEFDFILCSHVLEHIEDDRAAMKELFRVLKRGGTAIVNVPLRPGPTYEDPSIVTPEARTEHFGQFDHVRYYGHDIAQRLIDSGFVVLSEPYIDRFDAHFREHLGLKPETLFICRKGEASNHLS